MTAKGKSDSNLIATNRRARFDFLIQEKYEAGLVLKGSEVKSIRSRRVSLEQSFGRVLNGELHIVGMNIAPYEQAGPLSHEPLRPRKLLLHKSELARIIPRISQSGFTLIPLRLYFRRGCAKVEVAVATGRKKYDKREKIRRREAERDMRRSLDLHRRGKI